MNATHSVRYKGPITKLHGEEAIGCESSDGVIMVQFDNLALGMEWTHGWHPLPFADFEVLSNPFDEEVEK